MEGLLGSLLARFAKRPDKDDSPSPLLVELLENRGAGVEVESYRRDIFSVRILRDAVRSMHVYEIQAELSPAEILRLRTAISVISADLRPQKIEPLTFARLIDVLCQAAAAELAGLGTLERIRQLSRLASFEAVGIPTILALSLDDSISEFFVDAPASPVYLDHVTYGRCETQIVLTERERKALETHMDTFKGYTADFANPSLKNEFDVSGTKLRISLDLSPLAVSTFALDVRKLTTNKLELRDLVRMNVLTVDAATFLLSSLELGLNITIVGETGTGKTTLLNALDEALNPGLRRVYVEDAVETKDLLPRGFHQLKLKVDPFERSHDSLRTKSDEITKILHRSPDLVVLGELQSEEHSRAFFHALSAGVRGLQTFHASSPEQAIRRWREIHGIMKANILDLDLIVQMGRPDRLAAKRQVLNVSLVEESEGEARLRKVFLRGEEGEGELRLVTPLESLSFRRRGVTTERLVREITRTTANIELVAPGVVTN